jgi:hypothetical protein
MPPHSNEESCNSYGALFGSWLPDKDIVLCASATTVETAASSNNNDEESKYEKALEKAFAKLQEDQVLRKYKKKNKVKYNVKFFPEVEIYTIPNVSDLTRKEFRTMYLSREEMTNIHREAWKMVDLMNLGIEYEDVDNDDYEQQIMGFSKRGLVDLKDTAVERRRRMRENAYKVVFGVQAFHTGRQPIECMDGDAVMSDLYHKAATPAREEAYRVAQMDAAEAGYRY